nr:hypothetical protein [Chthoniobacterales bacterium]
MNIDLDDPNLTAYALGELLEPEQSRIAAALADSPEAEQFVQETQQLARLLKTEFRSEIDSTNEKPLNIMPLPEARSFWSDARWMSIGLAALLALAAVVAAVVLSQTRQPGFAVAGANRTDARQLAASAGRDSVVQMEVQSEPAVDARGPVVATAPVAPAKPLVEQETAADGYAPSTAASAKSANVGVSSDAYRLAKISPAEEFRRPSDRVQFNT